MSCTRIDPKISEVKGTIFKDTIFLGIEDTLVYSFRCDSSFSRTKWCPCYDGPNKCVCFLNNTDTFEINFYYKVLLLPLDSVPDLKERLIHKYSSGYQGFVDNIMINRISSNVDHLIFEVKNSYLHYKFINIIDRSNSLSFEILYKSKPNKQGIVQNSDLILKSFRYELSSAKK